MNIAERLLNLRKEKHLSQEEVAEKLNVSRQTISKWETGVSTPDFDKIIPLCKLYSITSDELLTGEKKNIQNTGKNTKKAKGIVISIFLYFFSIIWIMVAIPVLKINPIVATAIFLLIIAIGTSHLIYVCLVYKTKKTKKEPTQNKLFKKIDKILGLIILIIYLLISFLTFAWHITWIIWIIYVLIMEIIKLIFTLKGDCNEEE